MGLDKHEIKRSIDLPQYLLSRGFNLRKAGRSWNVEPCPVCGHRGHFSVAQNRSGEWYYNSFSGCIRGGDIFNFVMDIERAADTFPSAVSHLEGWLKSNV